MTTLSVTVCVLTYRRPVELPRCLALVVDQCRRLGAEPGGSVRADVLVVDNDPLASARPVVQALRSPLVRYVTEPSPGIPAGRNRALAETGEADLMVFVDDDEMPRDGWLAALVRTWAKDRPTAVMGRVVSEFAEAPTAWVQAGDFFRRFSRPTGTELAVAATNNLLLDVEQVRRLGVSFDPSLRMGGGEDNLFTRRLVRAGGRIVWCQEALVTDLVPASRTTRRWVVARSVGHGNVTATVELRLARGRLERARVRGRFLAGGLARLLGGALRALAGLVLRSDVHQARGVRTSARGWGMVSGAIGLAYQEYGRGGSRWHRAQRSAGQPAAAVSSTSETAAR